MQPIVRLPQGENRNVRRRRMDRAVSWITARGLPMVHLRGMPLHLFRARS
jgi:hypothetical protein